MALAATKIEERIRAALPDAEVKIHDLAGDGDHYAVKVVSKSFRGKSRIEQHRMVHSALREELGEALHALAIQTLPDQE